MASGLARRRQDIDVIPGTVTAAEAPATGLELLEGGSCGDVIVF